MGEQKTTPRRVHGGFTGPKSKHWIPAWSQSKLDAFSGICGLIQLLLIIFIAIKARY